MWLANYIARNEQCKDNTVSVSVSYLRLEQKFFNSTLRENPGLLLQRVFLQQGGAHPHYARNFKAFLNATFVNVGLVVEDLRIGRQKRQPSTHNTYGFSSVGVSVSIDHEPGTTYRI
jgi:hypothetical protein